MAHFTPQQISEASQAALDNWDFEVYLENGESQEKVEARKFFLGFTVAEAEEQWPDGLDCNDIYDRLEEYTTNMTSDLK